MRDGADLDLYGVLGVPRDATACEIRRAYRRLARQHHPDLNPRPDGSQQFAELAHAYEILHDPVERARYDRASGRSLAVSRRSHPHGPAWPLTVDGGTVRRGILQLTCQEAAYLARHPLALRDARGRTIVVPAGTHDGDQITVLQSGRAAVLTVRVPRTT